MRGTRARRIRTVAVSGIIPAYAGNTPPNHGSGWLTRDHPRICGEHDLIAGWDKDPSGSSPHMRGTHSRWKTVAAPLGIIPAYAGNTRRRVRCYLNGGDHPRICGEHISWTDDELRQAGSSPHMRGTPEYGKFAVHVSRIIPAYAGNTLRDYSNFVVSKFMSFVFHLV